MALLPLQVLRLHSLASAQRPYARGHHIDKTRAAAPLNCSGLNLAFPACPACSHKVTSVSPASCSSRSQWTCSKCRLDINQGNDVAWTFRLSLSFLPMPHLGDASSGRRWEREIQASALGTAAQPFFGCSATEWVEIVESAIKDITAAGAMVSADYLAQQMAVLADLVCFPSFGCLVADLRKSSSMMFAQHRVARIGIAKTRDGAAVVPEMATLRWLWKLLVCESLAVTSADSGHSTRKEAVSLRISDLFAAPRRLATNTGMHRISPNAVDSAQTIDYDCIDRSWKAQEPFEQPCLYVSIEERSLEAACQSQDQDHGLMDKAEVDQLFEHWSQLFFDEPQPTSESHNTNPVIAAGPLEARPLVDQSLSSHFLSESYYDECLQSMFVNSQKHLENAGVAKDTQGSHFSNDPSSFDDELLVDALSFSELIGSGLLSLSARPASALVPPRTPNSRAVLSAQSAYTTPLRHVDGEEQLVLAQETPVMQSTPVSNGDTERTGSVKETPLVRTKSLGDVRALSTQALVPLALSEPLDYSVPETPARDAGSHAYSKLMRPRVLRRLRSALDRYSPSAGSAVKRSSRRLSDGVGKRARYQRPPRLRNVSAARAPGAVPETPAAQASTNASRVNSRQSDLLRLANSKSAGAPK